MKKKHALLLLLIYVLVYGYLVLKLVWYLGEDQIKQSTGQVYNTSIPHISVIYQKVFECIN